ncbi:MAG: hypothetical protein VX988_10015 [Planctomycetota bacterium]|nr:hypothetical protein [Planctomycetota bacterium]
MNTAVPATTKSVSSLSAEIKHGGGVAARTWMRVGVADVLMFIVLIGVLQKSQGGLLDDPGLGWHIRNIDAMWAEGGWLTTDPFSGPRAGQPWRTNQWVGDLVLYGGWAWGGLEGIAAVTAIVLALAFRWLYLLMVDDGVPWPLAGLWTLVAAAGTTMSWVARPTVATLLFVMVTAAMMDRFHRGRATRRQTLWLLPMFVIWANTHGGFVAGLVIVASTLLVESCLSLRLPHRQDVSAARTRLKHLAALFAGAVMATLVNPYGWSLYGWIFSLLGDPYFMNLHTEWLSPNFHEAGAARYEILMLLLPLLLALGRRKSISWVALVLSIIWLHFALNGIRFVALWVVVTVPLMARLSADLLYVYWGRRQQRSGLYFAPARGSGVAALVICVGVFGWARLADGYSFHNRGHIPTAALQYVIERHPDQIIFHDYNWGGWLTWHGWPRVKNWIDDRNEVQGKGHVQRYFSIVGAEPGWESALRDHNVQVACLEPNVPLARELAKHSDWAVRYRDTAAVVYEKTSGRSTVIRPNRAAPPERSS